MANPRESKNPSVIHEIARYGLVARHKELRMRGCSDWSIRVAERDGLIKKVGPGCYALPGADPLDVRLARHQARRTCFSKASQLVLWVFKVPDTTHVAAAHGRPIPMCVVHRVSGTQDFFDILRHCVQCGTEMEAMVVLESAVVLKKCTIPQLRGTFNGRQDRKARAIIGQIDPQSMSIIETMTHRADGPMTWLGTT